MALISDLRRLWEPESYARFVSARTEAEQRRQTEAFCAASTPATQTSCLIDLFRGIWQPFDELDYADGPGPCPAIAISAGMQVDARLS
jgi:hypothetical protein